MEATDVILFHKNTFAFKFGEPIFSADNVPGGRNILFLHTERFTKDHMPILGTFCKGFKFNIKFEDENQPGHITNPPSGWNRKTFNDLDVNWDGRRLLINNINYWKAGEDWANKRDGKPKRGLWNRGRNSILTLNP